MFTRNLQRMILACLFLVTLALSFVVLGEIESSDEIKIKIWVDKSLYLVREPIFVNYSIRNVTDSLLLLSFHEIREYFVIRDQTDRFFGPSMRGMYGGGDSLLPQQTCSAWINITRSYEVREAGEYTCYIQMPSGGFFPYTGAKSNTIKIKVNNPKGEEKKALELFLEAEKLKWTPDKAPEKRALAFSKYLELADRFPTSVYAPQALRSAWGVYIYSRDLEERKKIIPVCKKLIESYPDSYYFVLAFTQIVDTYKILKDKEGAVKTMQELIKKHPDTRISEEAERRLKKIEKWEFK